MSAVTGEITDAAGDEGDELTRLDALGQANLISAGDVGAEELLTASLARAGRAERLNLIAHTWPERALASARHLDRTRGARREGSAGDPPALTGVPFLLKDLGATCAGAPATQGSAMLADYVPDRDAELVSRFRRSGLISWGKTTAAEFGLLPTTESSVFGAVPNPSDHRRSAGGSSGGAAAAVAAGVVAVAHGNDGGGSLRFPASCCGVFGFKPTRARVSMGPDVGDLMNGLVCEHVITRSVRDSAAVLDWIAGPVVGDPYPAPPEARRFRDAVDSGPDRVLRIGVDRDDPRLDADARAAVEHAAQRCAELGHRVQDHTPTLHLPALREAFVTVWAAGAATAVEAFAHLAGIEPTPEMLEPFTWQMVERGRGVRAPDYLTAVLQLQGAARALAADAATVDVVLAATASEAPPLLGSFSGELDAVLARVVEYSADTPLANVTGQPSMSLPLYRTPAGLPLGVNATGPLGGEYDLFALAGQLERSASWRPGPSIDFDLHPKPTERDARIHDGR